MPTALTLCADLRMGLFADTAAALSLLREAFSAGPASPGEPEFHLTLGSITRPDRHPDRSMQNVSWWDEGEILVISAGTRFLATIDGNRAVLDPGDAGRVGVHSLLFPVLSHVFAQRGDAVFHAAAFRVGESATLVLGGSGQGKSTVVTAAMRAGWPVLSDDLVVLRLERGELLVAGVPQPLALPAEFAAEALVGDAIPGDNRSRRVSSLHQPPDRGWHRVTGVLLVQHSEQERGELRSATGREVLHWALPSSWEGGTVGRAGHALPFAAALARLPAWHLGHAADVQIRLDAAIANVVATRSRL